MTQAPPGVELTAEVITLAGVLGPFPRARLGPAAAGVPARPCCGIGGSLHLLRDQ